MVNQGGFQTTRRVYDRVGEKYTLELDVTTFSTGPVYEIEIETDTPVDAKNALYTRFFALSHHNPSISHDAEQHGLMHTISSITTASDQSMLLFSKQGNDALGRVLLDLSEEHFLVLLLRMLFIVQIFAAKRALVPAKVTVVACSLFLCLGYSLHVRAWQERYTVKRKENIAPAHRHVAVSTSLDSAGRWTV